MKILDKFIKDGQITLNYLDARNFVLELFWSEIPFIVQYDERGDVIITDIRDDGK